VVLNDIVKIILWILAFVIVDAFFIYITPIVTGWIGEYRVKKILDTLPGEKYKTLNNIMLKTESGTVQIDHVVVSVFGIFVIETKNYSGRIIGNDYIENWTKNIYGHKYSFRNPLKQNWGHVKALENLLCLPTEEFISIVVFLESAKLNIKSKQHVVNANDLVDVIRSYNKELHWESELEQLVQKITMSNIDSIQNRQEHVNEIRKKLDEHSEKISSAICPKCGGNLVERKGKYGVFLGCSNYPKCRFTVKKQKSD